MAEDRLSQLAAYDERLRNQQAPTPDDKSLETLSPELTKAIRALRDVFSEPLALNTAATLGNVDNSAESSIGSQRCQAVESVSVRVHRLATVATKFATWRCPSNITASAGATVPILPDRFELTRELGSGGFGIVYQAYDTRLKRSVAIKILRPELVAHSTIRQRFLRESRAAARLEHPFIVRVLEVSESPESIWQVCQLVIGAPLSQHIARGKLPPELAARLARDLADATAHAHAHDVLHRDIKPENILLDCNPGDSLLSATLRLTDFGLARLIDTDATLVSHTGMLVGTPRYMAPEQLSGHVDEHGPWTDIYAIGIVLYEMLTGQNPFANCHTLQQRLVLLDRPIAQLGKLVPQVPRDLASICHKCLESRPEQRYRSAVELREDLDRFLRGDSTLARPLPLPVRMWRWSKHHRTTASVLAILLVTSGVIFAQTLRNNSIYRWQNSQLSQVNQRLTTQEQHSRELADLANTLREEALSKQERFADLAWKKGIREAYTAWQRRNYPEARELLTSLANSHPAALSRIEWRLLKADIDRQIKVLLALPCSLNEVRSIPNSHNVAVAAADGTVYIINIPTGQIVGQIKTEIGKLQALAISPDGRWLAVGGSVQADVDLSFPKIYDLETYQLARKLPGQATTIESLEYSADGQRLAVGCRYSTVKIFQLDTEQSIEMPTSARNLWLSASHKHNRFAAQSTARSFAITDANSPADTQTIEQPHDINGAAWLPSGAGLVVAIKLMRSVSIFTIEAVPRNFTLDAISTTAELISIISSDQLIAASLLSGEVLVWPDHTDDAERSVAPLGIWKLSNGPIHSLAIQGTWLVAASHDGQLIRLRIPQATAKPRLTGLLADDLARIHGQVSNHVQWSDDGRRLLAAKSNGEIRYIDTTGAQRVDMVDDDQSAAIYARWRIKINAEDYRQVLLPEIRSDGREHFRVARVSADERLWASARGTQLQIFGSSPLAQDQNQVFSVMQNQRDGISALQFSPDGSQLAWTGADAQVHTISLQDPDRRERSAKLKGQGLNLAWSNQGDRLAVIGQVPLLEFNPATGQLTEIIDYGVFAPCVAYNAQDHIVSGHRDGSIRFVAPDTRQTHILQIHPQEVRSLHFTDHGRIGISLDIEANLGVWFADGETIGLLPHDPSGDFGLYFMSPKAWTDSQSILKVVYNDVDGNLLIDCWNLEVDKAPQSTF